MRLTEIILLDARVRSDGDMPGIEGRSVFVPTRASDEIVSFSMATHFAGLYSAAKASASICRALRIPDSTGIGCGADRTAADAIDRAWADVRGRGTEMRYETTAHYDEALIRSVTRTYLMKAMGRDLLIIIALLCFELVFQLARGERGWFIGLLVGLIVLAIVYGAWAWLRTQRRSLEKFRQMESPEARITIDDDGISFVSGLGEGNIAWKSIRKVWCLPEAWLLFVRSSEYSTLPAECLTGEIRDFMRAKLNSTGVRLAGRCDETG